MKHEPRRVVRARKAFKTEIATYESGEVCNVRASIARSLLRKGLVEFVNVEDLENEGAGETEGDAVAPTGPWCNESDLGTAVGCTACTPARRHAARDSAFPSPGSSGKESQ